MGTCESTYPNYISKIFYKTDHLVWPPTRQGDWTVLLRLPNHNTGQLLASSTRGIYPQLSYRQPDVGYWFPAAWRTNSLGAWCQGVFGWGISTSFDRSWRTHHMTPWSPDVTRLDFSRVYKYEVRDSQLRDRIKLAVASITDRMLVNM